LKKDNEFFLLLGFKDFVFIANPFDCEQANHLWLILYEGFFAVKVEKP
jgi:hypothetical protein